MTFLILLLINTSLAAQDSLHASFSKLAAEADRFEIVYTSTSQVLMQPSQIEKHAVMTFTRRCGANCANTIEPLLEMLADGRPVLEVLAPDGQPAACSAIGLRGRFRLLQNKKVVATLFISRNSRIVQYKEQCWLLEAPVDDVLRTGVFRW